jgi:putative oxidoreductase
MKRSTKIIWWTLRIILGLLMLLGALTHITNTKEGEMANSAFITALVDTGYLWPIIGVTELFAGLAILAGRFIPLTLIVLTPITLNILLFHLSNPSPDGISIALAIILPHIGLTWLYRKHFSSLFRFNSSMADAPSHLKLGSLTRDHDK